MAEAARCDANPEVAAAARELVTTPYGWLER
jgi:hypothetical protein